ncbi:SapC family protein [Xanthobacter sp. DSM 24535]|uniref:SapC family protein n=1 Tax=Roseixanthobacter psychrophilus TaxID=3119917 RepID=UPI00372762F4
MDEDIFGFRPLRQSETCHWMRPRTFGFVEGLERVALGDSELLQTAHHLPIMVETARQRVQVVAGLSSRLLRHRLLDGEGRWMRPYVPIRLRCLPFAVEPAPAGGGNAKVLISDTLLAEAPEGGAAVMTEDGELSPAVADIARLLLRFEAGTTPLSAAAEQLLLADLLLPIGPTRGGGTLWTVATERLAGVTAARAALLTKPNMLGSQLLFSLLFSRRMLDANLGMEVHRIETPAQGGPAVTAVADPGKLEGLNFAMDESDMVPLDALSQAWQEPA